jgi:hypothetical protein
MKRILISLLLMVVFSAMANAQSDSDTDPNRWKRVKSWKGTFTFTSKDEITRIDGDVTLTSITDISADGNFTLDTRVKELSGSTGWHGKGTANGSVFWSLDTRDKNNSGCTVTQTSDPLAPLVENDGYRFEWFSSGVNSGKYFFTSGAVIIPSTINRTCDGTVLPPISQDWELGGASSQGFRTLPASGYHIVGDAEGQNFNAYNTSWIHWDLQPAEFYPATSNPCAAEAIYGDNSEQAELLREYRDKVLSKTPEGQDLIKTYYKFSPTVTKLLERNAELKNRIKAFIDNMLPGIRKKVAESNKEQ